MKDVEQEKFYFLEVNTRIQVEHPITEEVVGVDLVALQLFVAAGGKLASLPALANIQQRGHAIEVRLCAENAFNEFLPCTGTVAAFRPATEVLQNAPSDVRYEVGVRFGSEVSIHFDSMICKVVVWSQDRVSAIEKMTYVLRNTICQGLTTNQLFLLRVLTHPSFQDRAYTTSFIEQHSASLLAPVQIDIFLGSMLLAAVFGSRQYRREKNTFSHSSFSSIPRGFRNQKKDEKQDGLHYVSCDAASLGHPAPIQLLCAEKSAGSYNIAILPEEKPLGDSARAQLINKSGGVLTHKYYQSILHQAHQTLTGTLLSVQPAPSTKLSGKQRLLVDGKQYNYYYAILSNEEFSTIISIFLPP